MRTETLMLTSLVLGAGCAPAKPPVPAAAPSAAPAEVLVGPARPETVTVTVRDVESDRRTASLEFRLLEKEAQLEELSARLSDARDEVARTMAKLQSLSSRAEAASSIAEAEVALRTLRTRVGAQHPDVAESARLVQNSSEEFNRSNFGGAFYLASQAKARATTARSRAGDGATALRPGETAFAVPIKLKASSRGNVREGPGTNFAIAYSVDTGAGLTGYGYTDDWVRVMDDSGRSGWIYRTLVGRP